MKKFKTLQELNLCDDFLFARVMENEEVCRVVLELILKIKIKRVKLLESQMTKDVAYESKGVRLDIYVDDEDGNIYTVEMQQAKKYNIPKRSRYYHSIEDVDTLSKGCTYNGLHRNIVIFICMFDVFGYGRHKYSFEYLCLEDNNIKLDDETSTIILNTEGIIDDVDSDMKAFLAYVKSSTVDIVKETGNPVLETIHRQVETVKADKLMEVMYMKYEENMKMERETGHSEGYAEGLKVGEATGFSKGEATGVTKGKIEAALNMLKESMPIDLISRITGLPESEIEELAEK